MRATLNMQRRETMQRDIRPTPRPKKPPPSRKPGVLGQALSPNYLQDIEIEVNKKSDDGVEQEIVDVEPEMDEDPRISVARSKDDDEDDESSAPAEVKPIIPAFHPRKKLSAEDVRQPFPQPRPPSPGKAGKTLVAQQTAPANSFRNVAPSSYTAGTPRKQPMAPPDPHAFVKSPILPPVQSSTLNLGRVQQKTLKPLVSAPDVSNLKATEVSFSAPTEKVTPQFDLNREPEEEKLDLAFPRLSLDQRNVKLKNYFEFVLRKSIGICLHLQTVAWESPDEIDFTTETIASEFKADGRKIETEALETDKFNAVRKVFGISTARLTRSIRSGRLIGGVSSGKSSSYFYLTRDKQFVLKSLNQSELETFREILPKYVSHIDKYPNTFLPRFMALFRVTFPSANFFFLMTNNVFIQDVKMDVVYDLKGSTRNRKALESEKRPGKVPILKDIDFKENNRLLFLENGAFLSLKLQLETDTAFLEENNIIDYSILVGIHFMTAEEFARSQKVEEQKLVDRFTGEVEPNPFRSKFQQTMGGIWARSLEGRPLVETYYFGIIDVLQKYDLRKAVEGTVKSFRYDREKLSAVNPNLYARRFNEFLCNCFASTEEQARALGAETVDEPESTGTTLESSLNFPEDSFQSVDPETYNSEYPEIDYTNYQYNSNGDYTYNSQGYQ
eukprot:TRINITY_DN13438_c0_g1_i2.p2 TRINITY_DN13438_c0_g1~~TRINITY_DN13438_c0_g1_i2.p2  ORF type:complete len:671 (-),score=154.90 TRINITY_DN13438_c0_g1_i2:340-2352(-)